jgi:hypothetical protein
MAGINTHQIINNMHLHIIIVKVTAPQNYKPRTSTYRAACLSIKASYAKTAEKLFLGNVQKKLQEQNPGIDLKFSLLPTKTVSIHSVYYDNDN